MLLARTRLGIAFLTIQNASVFHAAGLTLVFLLPLRVGPISGFQATLQFLSNLPKLLPLSWAFGKFSFLERRYDWGGILIRNTLSWKGSIRTIESNSWPCTGSYQESHNFLQGRSIYWTPFHEQEERVGMHSCKGQTTLFIGELLHFAKIRLKKSQIWHWVIF